MLKYYLTSNQEAQVLNKQLTRQSMERQGDILEYDGSRALGSVRLTVNPIDRTFSFSRLGEGMRSYMQYTLCDSVTEVLKRTWNTWLPKQFVTDKGKWGKLYLDIGPDEFKKAVLSVRIARRHENWLHTEIMRSNDDLYIQTR